MKIEFPIQIEPKFDGIRCQVHIHENGKIQLFSRSLKEITNQFPDIVLLLQHDKTKSGIFDSEIYGINEDFSQLPFEKFQKRLGVKEVTAELIKEYPATIVLFDIIYHKNGYHNEVQFRRTQLLEECTSYYTPSMIIDHKEDLIKQFEHAIQLGYEGVMLKKMYAQYAPGEGKTAWKNWFKFKPNQTADVLIINGQLGTGDRRHVLASFDLAVMMSAGILYPVGKCGNGFEMKDLESLTSKAKIMQGIQNANVIIEIKFDKVSVNEAGEYAFRFARFVRFRPDKEIHEIDTLDMIKEYVK